MTSRSRNALVWSTGLTLVVVVLNQYSRRVGIDASWLFAKEGALENFTFAAALASAVWMAVAAGRAWRANGAALVLYAYGLCALVLFVFAMEEVSWGQTFFKFGTPDSWAAINHQRETTLHNLADQQALTSSARVIALVFAAGALALIAFARVTDQSWIAAIAPDLSLAPSALIIGYAGARLHPEIIEALIALFFLFYSYRVLRTLPHPVIGDAHEPDRSATSLSRQEERRARDLVEPDARRRASG